MGWQEIIVFVIGVITVFYVGYRIFRTVATCRKPSHSPCDGCGGCAAKNKK
ncbi:MAG: FeoB-associated Cys-rich membrane protein [Tannerellaceae bacterium]|nr:FeoB-associated Cys-rich membrane protein [Tannerellaceae bacterium]